MDDYSASNISKYSFFFSVFKHFGESIFVDLYLSSNNRRNV